MHQRVPHAMSLPLRDNTDRSQRQRFLSANVASATQDVSYYFALVQRDQGQPQ